MCLLFFFFFVFTLSYLFESEISDLLLGTLGHCHFHHYIHYWCDFHFMFDLGRSPLFFTYSLFRYHFYRYLWFILFPSHLILSLQRPISGLMLISHHHSTYHYQFILLHLSPYRHHIHVRHPQVRGSWDYYTCCISYMRAWFSDHWVFESSFLSFLLPYPPSLRYIPCLKTTLRPWDQMSSLTASTWTGVWDLVDVWISSCFFFWESPLWCVGLIQLCSDYRDHAFWRWMVWYPRFLTYCASDATLGHIPFHLEVYGSSRTCTIIITHWMLTET